LSPAIVQAVHGALRLFPADRYQSAAELGEALGRCLADPDDWRITRDMLVPLTDEQRAAPPAPGAAPVAEDDRSVTLESAGVGVAAEVEAPPSSGAVSTIDLGRGKAEASTSNDGDEGTAEAEAPGAAADDDGAADETSTRDEAEQEAPASDEAAEAEPSSDAVAPAKVPPTEARRAAAAPAAEARGGGGRLLLAVLAGAAVGAAALWYRSLSPAEPVVAPPVTSATAAASAPTAAPSATAAASMPSAAPSATASDTAPADDGAGDGGAALPTGKIKIVPAFAGVVVDGRRVPVVDGAVSIEGAVGSSHTVILTVAGRNFETTVSITATGPVPSEIAFVAGGSRPAVPGGPTPTGSKGADPYDG
jgi:hypothetical protein